MKIHYTVQFDITCAALEHTMRCRQLFAPDVVAYPFQIDEPVGQVEGKKHGKEGGDRAKGRVIHTAIDQACYSHKQQRQLINEELRGFRTKRNVSV